MVALSESDAQAWREGKVSRGRCGVGRRGSSLFIGAEVCAVVTAEEWPMLMGTK
jgi:hypothetical protein